MQSVHNIAAKSGFLIGIVSAIRRFHRFLTQEKIAPADPTEDFDSPRTTRALPSVLSQRDLEKILAAPDMRELWNTQGMEIHPSSPEQFAAFIRSETDKWAKVVKQAGITAE